MVKYIRKEVRNVGELVIRDYETGECKAFQPTAEGYAQADRFAQSITEQGHRVSDDHTGSLGRIGDYYGTGSSWF